MCTCRTERRPWRQVCNLPIRNRPVTNLPPRARRGTVSETAPAPRRAPRYALATLRFAARALLGLFVLFQAVFIVAYNVVDMKDEARDYLRKSRTEGRWAWALLSRWPAAGGAAEEWLDPPRDKKREETAIGAAYERVGK